MRSTKEKYNNTRVGVDGSERSKGKGILGGIFRDGGGHIDKVLLVTTLLLAVFGTLTVFSAGGPYAEAKYGDEYYFIKRQVIWLILGALAMVLGSKLAPEFYKKMAIPVYCLSIVLLILTLVIGFTGNGAQRWISIGPLTVQPSEIAKFGTVMMLAYYFDKNKMRATEPKSRGESFLYGTLIPLGIMLLPIVLVMLQRHLSCIVIMGVIGILLIVLAGIDVRYILGFIGAGAAGVSALALFTDYTKDRITVWLDPEKYKLTGGWQTLEGLMAIGSGGILGKGFGRGELKYCYVSEPANDMIYAILCEELGFVGGLAVIILFAIFALRCFRIAFKTEDTYQRLLCLGICAQITVQALLNIAVVTNTVPNTGISLPFFSYGGSSLIMLLFEVGILLSVSRDARIVG